MSYKHADRSLQGSFPKARTELKSGEPGKKEEGNCPSGKGVSTCGQQRLFGGVELNEEITFIILMLQMRTLKVKDIHLFKAAQLMRVPDLKSRALGL